MKRALLIIGISTLTCQLRAQLLSKSQLLTIPKSLKVDTNFFFKQLKGNNFALPKMDSKQLLAQLMPLNVTAFYSKMPVIKIEGNIDHMPIVVSDKPGELYPMMIKKINAVKVDSNGSLEINP